MDPNNFTPVRQTRSPNIIISRDPESESEAQDAIATTTASADPNNAEAALRAQLLDMKSRMDAMQQQLSANSRIVGATNQTRSREYWTFPTPETIVYPGENASRPAQAAYIQRLHAYLSKSQPVWDLVNGKLPCPLSTDQDALAALQTLFGATWSFKHKDMGRAMRILESKHPLIFQRVQTAIDDGSQLPSGSWAQRNAALHSTICDTLDLGKKGKDLDILQHVEENNGMALYDLIIFRLREIKSTDPLERAMQLNLGLTHIKYNPEPHGVATYFSDIEKHRTKLAELDPPKIIENWQVIAKTLRELPPLHPKFKEAEQFLAYQRKLLKTDTTLQECQSAFINADIDNDIHGDIKAGGDKSRNGKKRLRTNLAHNHGGRRPRKDDTKQPRRGEFKQGDCVHHPFSVTHNSVQCRDPFGMSSAFSKAVSYKDKCAAVRKSINVGWSPRATNVQIPEGYGCDRGSATALRIESAIQPPALRANTSSLHGAHNAPINDSDILAYHKVRALMVSDPGTKQQPVSHMVAAPAHRAQTPMATGAYNTPATSPLRAFHTSTARGLPAQTMIYPQFPMYGPSAYPLMAPHHMVMSYPTSPQALPNQPAATPQPVRSNVAAVSHQHLPPPTDDDLINAGIRYYATQAGNQHFR